MESLEQLRDRLLARFPGAEISIIINPGPAAQHSLQLGGAFAREIAFFLRDDPLLKLDFCSNVTGVDWPEKEIIETTKTTIPNPAGGAPKVVEQKTKKIQPGCLEVVYHLYSYPHRHYAILKARTPRDNAELPSVEGVWKAANWMEREIYDLLGVSFIGHYDLRRLLMPEDWVGYPLRKDFVEPDEYHGISTRRESLLR